MKTGQAGIDLIKRNEGCRLDAYQDIVGVWTIGYGDTLDVHPGMEITQAEAEEGLARRLANEFEPAVWAALGGKATQNQFDACVSLAWNIGTGAFRGSHVSTFHRQGLYRQAAASFGLWNKAGGVVNKGLVRRRAEEAALYLSDATAAVSPPAPSYDRYLAAKTMQAALQRAGLYTGAIDGKWGPASRAAYDAFDQGE